MPHIFDEFTTFQKQIVQLRQAKSAELSFVAIFEASGQSIVRVDPGCTPAGVYELRL